MSAVIKDVGVEQSKGALKQVEVREPKQRAVIKRVKKQKQRGLYSIQGLIFFSAIALFGVLFGQLYFDTMISRLHYDTQELKVEINRETVINQQLYSKIAELSMNSRVVEIAQAHGLDYQDNIISIGQ